MRLPRFLRRQSDEDLNDEIAHYLEMAAAEHARSGASPEEAARRARVDFGGIESAKEGVRSAGWRGTLDSVVQDVRYAFRNLRGSPGYAALAIGTLSIGLALTTAVLTAANTVLREPWAVANASRVFLVLSRRGAPVLSPAGARFIASRATAIGEIVTTRCVGGLNDGCALDLNGESADVDLVSGNYFSALGVPLQLGRGFVAEEDRIDDPRSVVVISDDAWRSRFGADPGIVGRRIRIDDVPFTVIGVTAAGFAGTRTEPREAWVPLSALLALRPNRQTIRDQLATPSPDLSEVQVAARLAPGISRQRAESEVRALVQSYDESNHLQDRGARLTATTLFPNPSKQNVALAMFSLMFVAVLLVLLLACANVGNLLLARAAARGREIAIRLALGAGRPRIVRQLLIESAVLAAASGTLGVAIAYRLPGAIMAGALGRLSWHFVPNTAVLAAALALTAFTCVGFGLAPALHATRADVASVFKGGSDASRGGRSRLRAALLSVQIAVSVVLVLNAGLLVRGVRYGPDHDIGFDPSGVATVAVTVPESYDSARVASFARQLVEQSGNIGATQLAFVRDEPLSAGRRERIRLPGESDNANHLPWIVEMSPGTLGLLRMPLVAGRDLAAANDDDAVLVNESLARILWPGEQALGKTILDDGERRVVGIVKDAAVYRLDRVEGVLFRPLRSAAIPVLLARGASTASAQAMTAVAQRLDSRARVSVDSLSANADRQLGPSRVTAELASVLGILALVLAAVGVFGVFSFIVEQRTREIGIRTALGASSRHVVTVIARENLGAVVGGLLVGLVAALGVAKVLENQMSALYGVSAADPIALAGTIVLLALAGAVATWVPARRAARIDPMIALRQE